MFIAEFHQRQEERPKMKRIAFFQNDLGVGGIQKSLVNLLCNLDYSRFEVDLYLSRPD